MFRALFLAILSATLMVNIIFLFATKDKPPDVAGSTTLVSLPLLGNDPSASPASWPGQQGVANSPPLGGANKARLFLRSNDFYDYAPAAIAAPKRPPIDQRSRPIGAGGSDVGMESKQVINLESSKGGRPPGDDKFADHHDDGASSTRKLASGGNKLKIADQPSVPAAPIGPQLVERKLSSASAASLATTSAPTASNGTEITTFAYDNYNDANDAADDAHQANGVARTVGARSETTTTGTRAASRGAQWARDNEIRPNNNVVVGGGVAEEPTPTPVEDRQQPSRQRRRRRRRRQWRDGGAKPAKQKQKQQDYAAAAAAPGRRARLRVKSSKNHVLISLDDSIIYQAGRRLDASEPSPPPAGDWRRPSSSSSSARWRARGLHNANANRVDAGGGQTTPPPPSGDDDELQRAVAGENKEVAQNSLLGEHDEHDEHENNPTTSERRELDEASRGIHVVVLNQFSGSVMASRLFDTYSPQQDEELTLFLHQVQPGRLLVLAVKDEASFKMARSSGARKLLASLGSRHIQELGWRDTWALVLAKPELLETDFNLGERRADRQARVASRANLAEAIGKSTNFAEWGRAIEIEATVELKPELVGNELNCFNQTSSAVPFESSAARGRRRAFCSRVEGYGRVCDCSGPSQIEFRPGQIANSRLSEVPIVVIASQRPYYLFRMLASLLQARGVNSSLITVFIDGRHHREPAEVCQLFGVRHIEHEPTGSRSSRISSHYRISLSATFHELFPRAQFAIIFEEDLDVAPDALAYFERTLPLLKRDPSLYCVSAWNDQGYEHSVGDLERVYRIETMPGLGWMLSRRLFVEELEPQWPPASQQHDWDMWIRTSAIRRNRECLIPDISRTFHFGATGTNINAYFQRLYFNKHAFSANYLNYADLSLDGHDQNNASFKDLDQLTMVEYDQQLEQIIQYDSKLISWRSSSDTQNDGVMPTMNKSLQANLERDFLCSLANLTHYYQFHRDNTETRDTFEVKSSSANDFYNVDSKSNQPEEGNHRHEKTNVIFINMIDGDDYANWLQLAKCWRLWDLDARGQHKSAWRLYLNGRPMLVVGHPASPLSRLKPNHLVPFDLRAASAA